MVIMESTSATGQKILSQISLCKRNLCTTPVSSGMRCTLYLQTVEESTSTWITIERQIIRASLAILIAVQAPVLLTVVAQAIVAPTRERIQLSGTSTQPGPYTFRPATSVHS